MELQQTKAVYQATGTRSLPGKWVKHFGKVIVFELLRSLVRSVVEYEYVLINEDTKVRTLKAKDSFMEEGLSSIFYSAIEGGAVGTGTVPLGFRFHFQEQEAPQPTMTNLNLKRRKQSGILPLISKEKSRNHSRHGRKKANGKGKILCAFGGEEENQTAPTELKRSIYLFRKRLQMRLPSPSSRR
ncbi:hypothetical protein E6C27_scaffold149G001090 [Cucumis melo var. makuwa]|uniref:Uncharacterized protein n=1 Tax=Cucumis melo var. makuwa TaxID=1194695 RepID=A0A5A7TU42_CUCMM|nr:hypothetical protein E6C27_scaffold149G001090 [Cucumis melo var. makuwa]